MSGSLYRVARFAWESFATGKFLDRCFNKLVKAAMTSDPDGGWLDGRLLEQAER